jgi:hypothetical protein
VWPDPIVEGPTASSSSARRISQSCYPDHRLNSRPSSAANRPDIQGLGEIPAVSIHEVTLQTQRSKDLHRRWSCRIVYARRVLSQAFAYCFVHSWAVAMACDWFSFHAWATSFARGSSGFGAPRRAWMERRMVRIWRAGDQLPAPVSQDSRTRRVGQTHS